MRIGIVLVTMSKKEVNEFTVTADVVTFVCDEELNDLQGSNVIENAIEIFKLKYPDFSNFKGVVKYIPNTIEELYAQNS